jgi:hypothetical protein
MSNRWRPLRGEHVEARALAGALRQLVDTAGLSLGQLADVIPFGKSTISDKLNGQSRPQWAFVEAVVRACTPRDARARGILEARFTKLWEQADPDRATLLPLDTPQRTAPRSTPDADSVDADPVVPGQLQAIVTTLNSIAAKQERVAQTQLELSRSHELFTAVLDFQQRLEAAVQELLSDRENLREERDRPAAAHEHFSRLDERHAAVLSQLADTQQRLASAHALQEATEQRLRAAQQQRRLANKLRDQATSQLDQALAAIAGTVPRQTANLPVRRTTPDPRPETSVPAHTFLGPADQEIAAAVLARMQEELTAGGAHLALLETAITESPQTGPWPADARGPRQLAIGRWRLRVRRRAVIVLLLSVLVGAGAVIATTAMTNDHKVSGFLTCSSGHPVVGVWLHGTSASGWAKLENTADGRTEYSYKLPRGNDYSLHVGCGGTSDKWAVDPHTAEVSGTRNSFDCFDVPNYPLYKTCRTHAGH